VVDARLLLGAEDAIVKSGILLTKFVKDLPRGSNRILIAEPNRS